MTDAIKTMMVLGGFKFHVGRSGYDELIENFYYKWNEIERAKDVETLQFNARKLKTIDLKGVLLTQSSGLSTFDELKKKAANGEAMILVDGRGGIHGRYVILSLKLSASVFLGQGVPKIMSFDMSLKEYKEYG